MDTIGVQNVERFNNFIQENGVTRKLDEKIFFVFVDVFLTEHLLLADERSRKKVRVEVLPSPKIEVVNIVASGDLKIDNLNLNQVAMALGLENIEYEPEQFPGLVFRMKDPKVVILIFSTGKVICTGAKSKENVDQALKNMHRELEEHDFL